jgi:hypothetical protein
MKAESGGMRHLMRCGLGDAGGGGRGLAIFPRLALWLGALLWAIGGLMGCHQRSVQGSAAAPGVSVRVAADKAVYAQGEPIQLTLEVVNHGAQPVTLRFPTAQRYDVVVREPQGRQVWRWSADQMFAQVLGEETLAAAGGRLTYRVAVREPLPAGRYAVIGSVPLIGGALAASTEIDIR